MRDLDLILQYGRPWTERTVPQKIFNHDENSWAWQSQVVSQCEFLFVTIVKWIIIFFSVSTLFDSNGSVKSSTSLCTPMHIAPHVHVPKE